MDYNPRGIDDSPERRLGGGVRPLVKSPFDLFNQKVRGILSGLSLTASHRPLAAENLFAYLFKNFSEQVAHTITAQNLGQSSNTGASQHPLD